MAKGRIQDGKVELTEDVRGMEEDMEVSSRKQCFALRIRRSKVCSLYFSLPFMPQSISENTTFIQPYSYRQRPPRSQRLALVLSAGNQGRPLLYSLSCSLEQRLALKLTLLGSSTPFVTGKPYALIFNGSVTSSGAVGVALSAGRRPTLQTEFPSLRAITPPPRVTR